MTDQEIKTRIATLKQVKMTYSIMLQSFQNAVAEKEAQLKQLDDELAKIEKESKQVETTPKS